MNKNDLLGAFIVAIVGVLLAMVFSGIIKF